MIYVLHFALAFTAFLMALNGRLRGTLRSLGDAILGSVCVALLVIVFIAFGWKAGLLAFCLVFVYGAIGDPIAARIAARLL